MLSSPPPDGTVCVDAARYERVVDFTCLFAWSRAFFHRLLDCVVPNYELFEYAVAVNTSLTLLLIPKQLTKFVDLLLPNAAAFVHTLPGTADNNRTCVLVSNDTLVTYETSTLGTPEEQRDRAARFRDRALRAAGGSATATTRPYVVFIERRKTREMQNTGRVKELVAARLPTMPLVSYHGNESMKDTIRLFAHARVVIGFHGAGFVNALFCRSGTVVLEFSLFMDETHTKLWRTNNKVAKLHGSLNWITYPLQLNAAAIPDWGNLHTRANGPVADLFQNLPLVRVPETDARKALDMVKGALDDNAMRGGRAGGPFRGWDLPSVRL